MYNLAHTYSANEDGKTMHMQGHTSEIIDQRVPVVPCSLIQIHMAMRGVAHNPCMLLFEA